MYRYTNQCTCSKLDISKCTLFISKLTYMVLQIMTQHDAIYLVGSLIMMNDGPSLLSLIFNNWAEKCV